MITFYKNKFSKRKTRIRSKLRRLSDRLRLSVCRSQDHIYSQIIDDHKGNTLVSACDQQLKDKDISKMTKLEVANLVGQLLATRAKKLKISKVYLDRGGYKYHGRVKALAQGARQGGLKF